MAFLGQTAQMLTTASQDILISQDDYSLKIEKQEKKESSDVVYHFPHERSEILNATHPILPNSLLHSSPERELHKPPPDRVASL